jgi:hypothetical protein
LARIRAAEARVVQELFNGEVRWLANARRTALKNAEVASRHHLQIDLFGSLKI